MEYGTQLVFALILSIPVACITWTVTQEEVFQEMRRYLIRYQDRYHESWWRRKLAYFPTCPYCLSHYVSGLLIALLQFKMLAEDWRGYLVSLFTLVLIANVYITVYHLLRVALRWAKSLADRAEKPAFTLPQQAVSSPPALAPMDLTPTVPLRHRSVRSVPSGRRA